MILSQKCISMHVAVCVCVLEYVCVRESVFV